MERKKVEPLGLSSERQQLGLCCCHLLGLGLGILDGNDAVVGSSSSERVVQRVLGRGEGQLSCDVNVLDGSRVLAHHGVERVATSLRADQLRSDGDGDGNRLVEDSRGGREGRSSGGGDGKVALAGLDGLLGLADHLRVGGWGLGCHWWGEEASDVGKGLCDGRHFAIGALTE